MVGQIRFTNAVGGTVDWTYPGPAIDMQSPASAGAVNGTTYAYYAQSLDMSQWEIGRGVYTAGTGVFARTTISFNSLGSTTKINFSNPPQVMVFDLLDSIATIGHPNKGYFLVNRNGVAGSGTAAAYNKVQFTTEAVDSQGWFDNATNYRFQPTESGYYFFVLAGSSPGNVGGTNETCQSAIYKNGSSIAKGTYIQVTATLISVACGVTFLNGSTDYVEGFIYLPTGVTAVSGQADNCYMAGWKVGP